jgi:predicted Zn finger-like uncharacterized protein
VPILNCPTCGSKLEVIDEDLGHVVQCGSCQQTFTAEDPSERRNDGASRKPNAFNERDDDDRPSRRRERDPDEEDDRPSRRRREDDDHPDDGYRPRRSRYRDDRDYEDQYGATPKTGLGLTSMILGISALVTTPGIICCVPVGAVCAVLGLIFGIMALKTDGRGLAIAGIIMSILALLGTLGWVLFSVLVTMAQGGGV